MHAGFHEIPMSRAQLRSSTNQRFHAGIVTCQNSNFYSDTVAQEKEAREDRAKLEEKEKYEVVSLSLHILT